MDEHSAAGTTALFARVLGICVEKNHHLPPGTLGPKYEGCAVNQANDICVGGTRWHASPSLGPFRSEEILDDPPSEIAPWRNPDRPPL